MNCSQFLKGKNKLKNNILTTFIFTLPIFFGACSSTPKEYITGSRGGCYFVKADGKKSYVDKSKCEEQEKRRNAETEEAAKKAALASSASSKKASDEVQSSEEKSERATEEATGFCKDLPANFYAHKLNEVPDFTPVQLRETRVRIATIEKAENKEHSGKYQIELFVRENRILEITIYQDDDLKEVLKTSDSYFTRKAAQKICGFGFKGLRTIVPPHYTGMETDIVKTRYIHLGDDCGD